MNKVLHNFRANRTLKNAEAVVKYHRAHPMASCMLSGEDVQTFHDAFYVARAIV